ncbi:tetratricopeptide repeat protein [Treponema brennaborense]|uniref:Lipoprotein n=1 Tax=Treponema brennaborense (strain DSM 12168 / CIP 105900 / DD5/3) TaxID=906968 RepID=F4LMK2_TREBD|nr:tetratricopeptide repeat protein [Treponema brennaborense]AEE16749.1 hypothetical protein Trebr_1322 [Treponema brennaborense DSM 12168]
MKRICTVFVLITLLTGCATTNGRKSKLDMHGMIYDWDNRPVGNYLIRLDNGAEALSDISGRFALSNIKRGTYAITGSGTGYERFSDTVDITDSRQILYIRIATIGQLLDAVHTEIRELKTQDAERHIATLLQTDPGNTDALYYQAIIHYRNRRFRESVNLLETIEQSGDTDPAVYRLIADCWKNIGNREKESVYERIAETTGGDSW